jgi:hypothetical protein
MLPIWGALRRWSYCSEAFDASAAAALHHREIRLDERARVTIGIELAQQFLADPQDGNHLGKLAESLINISSRKSLVFAVAERKSLHAEIRKSRGHACCRSFDIIAHFTVGLDLMRGIALGLKGAC